jgi:hypothetical protein
MARPDEVEGCRHTGEGDRGKCRARFQKQLPIKPFGHCNGCGREGKGFPMITFPSNARHHWQWCPPDGGIAIQFECRHDAVVGYLLLQACWNAMKTKFSPPDDALYERIDEVLHCVWDPIGVSGVAAARDEYQSYVPAILGLLKDSADAERIAAHLNDITSKRMGLNEDGKKALSVARILLGWKKALLESRS